MRPEAYEVFVAANNLTYVNVTSWTNWTTPMTPRPRRLDDPPLADSGVREPRPRHPIAPSSAVALDIPAL